MSSDADSTNAGRSNSTSSIDTPIIPTEYPILGDIVCNKKEKDYINRGSFKTVSTISCDDEDWYGDIQPFSDK
jgi:hypothetical protein